MSDADDPSGAAEHDRYSHRGRQQRNLNSRNKGDNPDGSDQLPLPLPEPKRT